MSNIKSFQRLLVVQALYQLSINKIDEKKSIKDIFLEIIDKSENKYLITKSNLNFAEKIYNGVSEYSDQIENDLRESLNKKRKVERIDNLLNSIFLPAIYELNYGPKLSKKIIISEYLMIADQFFSEKEISLLNGVLDKV